MLVVTGILVTIDHAEVCVRDTFSNFTLFIQWWIAHCFYFQVVVLLLQCTSVTTRRLSETELNIPIISEFTVMPYSWASRRTVLHSMIAALLCALTTVSLSPPSRIQHSISRNDLFSWYFTFFLLFGLLRLHLGSTIPLKTERIPVKIDCCSWNIRFSIERLASQFHGIGKDALFNLLVY